MRRAAAVQQRVGPAIAVRGGKRLTPRDITRVQRKPATQSILAERRYGSQAKAVEKAAKAQRTTGTVTIHGAKVPRVLFSKDPRELKAAGLAPSLGEKIAASPAAGLRGLGNAAQDLVELTTTTPSSLAHLATTAATDPLKVPGMLVKPYTEVYHHPGRELWHHPVSTALMFLPGAKIPGRGLGRVARATGRQTLERPAGRLEGTTIVERRTGSRDYFKRKAEQRADVKGPQPRTPTRGLRRGLPGAQRLKVKAVSPKVTAPELRRRVDEFYDVGQQHKQRAVNAAVEQANERFKGLPKDQRAAKMEEHVSGARGGAHQHVQREFAREFGSHWQVHHPKAKNPKSAPPKPIVVKPKNVGEHGGHIHADRADAVQVAEAINKQGLFEAKVMELEGATPGTTSGYAVVPKAAAERYGHHGRVGRSPATGSAVMRIGAKQFRKTVLPYSTKWLGGQVVEAVVRAAAQGAGPTSLLRYQRLMRELERQDPKAAKALADRVSSGQFGVTGPASEFVGRGRTISEELAPTGLAGAGEAITRAGTLPGVRHVRAVNRRYSHVIFNEINGRVEHIAKQAMAGKALKQGPLLEKHVGRLTDAALADAAKGLHSTSSQVQLARAVDRAYGKYSRFGPHMRETIMYSTPFIPWFLNMGRFLTRVMPKDHPIKTSLIASLNVASEDWRKANRLSTRGPHVPNFMLGSMPAPAGLPKSLGGGDKSKFIPLGRFGPFLPGEPVSAAGGQVIPQFGGMLLNLAGADWTGQAIKGPHGGDASQPRLAANAFLTGLETFIPGLSQADRVSGLGEHYVRGKKQKQSVAQGKSIKQGLLDMLNPIKPVGASSTSTPRKKKARGGAVDILGGGGKGPVDILK